MKPMTTWNTPRRCAIVDSLTTSSWATMSTPTRPSAARRGSSQVGCRAGGTGSSTVASVVVNSSASSAISVLRP